MAAVVTKKWSEHEEGADTAADVYEVTGVSSGPDAIAAVGIAINTPHDVYPRLKSLEPSIRTPRGPAVYEVWVRYSIPPAGEHKTPGSDPLLEPPDIQWSLTIES